FLFGDLAVEPSAAPEILRTLLVGERDIGRAARSDRDRDAAKLGLHRIVGVEQGVQCKCAGFARKGNPLLKRRDIADAGVGGVVDRQRRELGRASCRERVWTREEAVWENKRGEQEIERGRVRK